MLTKSNARAYAILALLIGELQEEELEKLIVQPYINGRENGFYVRFLYVEDPPRDSPAVVFARDRRSDQTVIYVGKSIDFSMQGNIPSEEVYKKKKLYSSLRPVEAMQFIFDTLHTRQG